jgi:hypothetical protein
MRNTLRIALVCCSALAAAHAAETAAERGKRVVNEALQALGGAAFQSVQDRVETGRAYSFYRDELSGLSVARIYTRYLKPANPPVPGTLEARERESFGKQQESSAVLFSEDGAWELTFRGARPISDQRYENFKDSTLRNVFYILRKRLAEPGLAFYWQASDLYENRPVEIVDITDARNVTVTVYFSRIDKLPVRQIFKRRNPEFKDFDTEVTVFAKYRDVGAGVRWPFSIRRERNGEKIFEMYSDSVEINKGLTDDLFNLPAGIKTLPKQK